MSNPGQLTLQECVRAYETLDARRNDLTDSEGRALAQLEFFLQTPATTLAPQIASALERLRPLLEAEPPRAPTPPPPAAPAGRPLTAPAMRPMTAPRPITPPLDPAGPAAARSISAIRFAPPARPATPTGAPTFDPVTPVKGAPRPMTPPLITFAPPGASIPTSAPASAISIALGTDDAISQIPEPQAPRSGPVIALALAPEDDLALAPFAEDPTPADAPSPLEFGAGDPLPESELPSAPSAAIPSAIPTAIPAAIPAAIRATESDAQSDPAPAAARSTHEPSFVNDVVPDAAFREARRSASERISDPGATAPRKLSAFDDETDEELALEGDDGPNEFESYTGDSLFAAAPPHDDTVEALLGDLAFTSDVLATPIRPQTPPPSPEPAVLDATALMPEADAASAARAPMSQLDNQLNAHGCKIAVHFLEGDVLRGNLDHFDPVRRAVRIALDQRPPREVPLTQVKALFFVTSQGHPSVVSDDGVPVTVTFDDGRSLTGVKPAWGSDAAGFLVLPANPDEHWTRVWISQKASVEVS